MKKLLIIVSLTFFCCKTYTQKEDYTVYNPDDHVIIDSIKNIYACSNYKLLVYQTGYNNECISSILLIRVENKTRYWCILYGKSKDTMSLKVEEGGCIENDSIFTYAEYEQTGITKKEELSEGLEFLAPSRESEKVFYEDNHNSLK